MASTVPTLLIFTRGPRCEGERRRLLPASLQHAEIELHRHGLLRLLRIGRRLGLRPVVASSVPLELPADVEQIRQCGDSFSARLCSSLTESTRRYPQAPIVLVGTDSPDLGPEHLRQALAWLAESPTDTVVGPARDGGFYLLASRLPLERVLAEVQWCRSDTLETLEQALRRQGMPCRRLGSLIDLDHASDLEVWLSRKRFATGCAWIGYLLRSLLSQRRRPRVQLLRPWPSPALPATAAPRGPPD